MEQINTLTQRLASGKLTRRDFMQGALAMGLSVSAASMIVSKAEAATPKSGGRLRQAFSSGSTTDSLDPLTNEGASSMINVGWTYGNNLTEVADDGSLIPELAESFEATDDAKNWTFKLRKGVEFHNGKSLTAEDVIATLNRHRGEESKSPVKSLLNPVKEIRKEDDQTVVFDLEAPNADFPFVLSDYHMVILPLSKDGEIDATAGIGTGGYVIESFEPGVRGKFKRNPNYWKEGRAHFGEIETLIVPDSVARQNALTTNELDVVDLVEPKTVHLLARSTNLKILEVTGTQHRTTVMRLDTPPFDNFDLRMALKLSVKRQELVDKILRGHGTLGNDHNISPAQQYFNTELPQREYDPDKARHHLKKAGMEGIELELYASDAALDGTVDAAQLIQASAKPVGINVKVNRMPVDGYWANVWNQPGKGWSTSYWAGRPTCDWMFSSCCVADSDWNDTAWKTTDAAIRFNQLVVAARAELDQDKRREMYWECQRLLNEDGGELVWTFSNYISALSKKVMHPEKVAGNWVLDGNKNTERWWFA